MLQVGVLSKRMDGLTAFGTEASFDLSYTVFWENLRNISTSVLQTLGRVDFWHRSSPWRFGLSRIHLVNFDKIRVCSKIWQFPLSTMSHGSILERSKMSRQRLRNLVARCWQERYDDLESKSKTAASQTPGVENFATTRRCLYIYNVLFKFSSTK